MTLTQAEDYLTKAQANAPQMALATALCIVSPIPLLALGTVSELGLLGLDDNLAGGLGMIALLVLVAVAVVLFMQCGAAVREYEFWKGAHRDRARRDSAGAGAPCRLCAGV